MGSSRLPFPAVAGAGKPRIPRRLTVADVRTSGNARAGPILLRAGPVRSAGVARVAWAGAVWAWRLGPAGLAPGEFPSGSRHSPGIRPALARHSPAAIGSDLAGILRGCCGNPAGTRRGPGRLHLLRGACYI